MRARAWESMGEREPGRTRACEGESKRVGEREWESERERVWESERE